MPEDGTTGGGLLPLSANTGLSVQTRVPVFT